MDLRFFDLVVPTAPVVLPESESSLSGFIPAALSGMISMIAFIAVGIVLLVGGIYCFSQDRPVLGIVSFVVLVIVVLVCLPLFNISL